MVELRDLSVFYGRRTVLSRVNALFKEGAVTAIIGPSGCGKTTLIRAIAGLLQTPGTLAKTSGEVFIHNEVLTGVRSKTACVFQDFGLLPWKTVLANAELPLLITGMPYSQRRERVKALLTEFGLGEFLAHYPRELSGGMKQRLALVRALAAESDLLLMDEPFSGLDAFTREDAQDFLLGMRKTHPFTLIIVTHSIEEAAYLADQVMVMTGGNKREGPGAITAVVDIDHQYLFGRRPRRTSPRFTAICAELRTYLGSRFHQEET
jgi:NitT/TauT family transport system ATP-binding protein